MTLEEKKKASMREGMRGVWRHVRPYKNYVVALAVLGLVSAIANGLVPYITGRFFNALIAVASGEKAVLAGYPAWAAVLGIWAAIQLVANGTDWVKDRLRRALDMKVRFNVQTTGFVHFLYLPLSYHANAKISGELSKVSNASWSITSIVRTIADVVPQFLSVAIGITLAISISPPLALVLAAGVVVYVITLIPMLIPIAAEDDIARRTWNDTWNDAAEAVHQVAAVKQASAEAYEERKTNEGFFGKVYALWMKLERTWSNIGFFQRMIVFLTQLSVFVLSVQFVANGTITIGELVALNGYAMMFFGPFVALGYSWQTIQNGLTSATHLESILALEEETYRPANAKTAPIHSGEVAFDHVTFRYQGGEGVLTGMSFTTKPGESVALVGESGAGKSSTLALISGYYFPNEGKVSIGGIDTREWDLVALRQRIAIVPQEVALFNDTLRSNIRYGMFNATDAEVEAAARKAHIDEFIRTLSQGYDTLVGERGIKLSVGQKQRVAIARALLRDPEILILDEPTSALNSKTEQLITSSLEKLMHGRTTFIIAHRLSTVRRADKILVLDKGKIVEQGSHAELTQVKDGNYRRLYELQIGLHE